MQVKGNPRAQRGVLGLALFKDPTPLSIGYLERWVGDEAESAVAELVEAGLLRRDGDAVRPTRAALYLEALEAS